MGFFSYDTVRYVEKKKLPFEKAPKDDRGLPDIHLSLYKNVVVFDHVSKVKSKFLSRIMRNKLFSFKVSIYYDPSPISNFSSIHADSVCTSLGLY